MSYHNGMNITVPSDRTVTGWVVVTNWFGKERVVFGPTQDLAKCVRYINTP